MIDFPGLTSSWSRQIPALDHRGVPVTWHVLDTHPDAASVRATVLAVHGNPTWSYAWRDVLTAAPPDIRVIAVDQLDMGWSDRTGVHRRLADRVNDLDRLWQALNLHGPVIVAAHDWGGPIALGVAVRHAADVAGCILTNTGLQPVARTPGVLRFARAFAPLVTEQTNTFVRGTTLLSRLPSDVADAYAAPYRERSRRRAIREFVQDIPDHAGHPSAAALASIAEDVKCFANTPVLLIWGARDPVFSDRYLHDLERRFPRAQVERIASGSHLVMEDAENFGALIMQWIEQVVLSPEQPGVAHGTGTRLWDRIIDRRTEDGIAIADCVSDQDVSWALLADRVEQLASGFHVEGIQPGDRVALLIPPSPTLIAVVYALWRLGACAVIADAGLGARHLRTCLKSAGVQHVIGIPRGLAFARTLAIPGRRISTNSLATVAKHPLQRIDVPDAEMEAAVVFTSGATGPAKGVVYRQAHIERTRDAIAATYGITESDALVAAFAPWAVLGPALGIPSSIPDMDLTNPSTLRATALADATARVGGTFTWVSPAALRSVLDTADQLGGADREALAGLRLVLAAGAPVPASLLRQAGSLFPHARLGTPYGMTEVLPVCHVDEAELTAAGLGNGVLVGAPIAGVRLHIESLAGGETGEIHVAAPHMRDRYDRRAALDLRSSPQWHATGDVGHLDGEGRLWIEGRLAHVIETADGIVTPVGIEQVIECDSDVTLAAAVGIGPRGTQQVVGIVVPTGAVGSALADQSMTNRIRARVAESCGVTLAAVLQREVLPTDIRHHAKIDRAALARWANAILQGS